MLSSKVSSVFSLGRQVLIRQIRISSVTNSDIQAQFEDAKTKLDTLSEDPGNETKLKIYGLFKQATLGPNETDKPGAFNFVAQAKWAAWSELGTMSQDDAKQNYIDTVDELAKKEGK